MAQYTFTGYDASAHMSEETRNPDMSAPKGIVNSIVVSLIAGWILILAITFVIPTNPKVYAAIARRIRPGAHLDGRRHGRAEFLLIIAFMAQAYCGMASVTANSRMLYAFSRDGAVPGHRSGTGSTPAPGRRPTASGSASCSPSSWPSPRCGAAWPTPPSRR